jgi:hypothetical protein
MSNYTVIQEIGNALIELLYNEITKQNEWKNLPANSIILGFPEENADSVRLSLLLYQIIENAHLKNQEMQTIDSSKLRHRPLVLDLFYMLTSHPLEKKTSGTGEEHRILGKAMQILYDNSPLELENKPAIERLHITLNPISLDDMTKIWTTFQKPYRLSVCYLVTPVRIDSERDMSVKRVVEKETAQEQMVPKREEE